jgi:hypothetical protein
VNKDNRKVHKGTYLFRPASVIARWIIRFNELLYFGQLFVGLEQQLHVEIPA